MHARCVAHSSFPLSSLPSELVKLKLLNFHFRSSDFVLAFRNALDCNAPIVDISSC